MHNTPPKKETAAADEPGGKRAAVVLSPRRLSQEVRQNDSPKPYWRPKTRADCVSMPRPCPFVGCKYHLATDVLPDGSLRMAFGVDIDALSDMPATCALDVAAETTVTLDRVARISNLTRERVRQIEVKAAAQLRHRMPSQDEEG